MRWTVHIEGGPRRVNHAAVCIGDKIYSFGGYCSTEEYKDWDPIPVLALDTVTLRWTNINYKKTEIPYQRYGHTTVGYGHRVFMWGGRNNAVACDSLCCFDTINLEWSQPPVTGRVPYAKDGHSACVIKNKMYIFGGFEYMTDQYSQKVHCLDLDSLVWTYIKPTGPSPSPRDFHTAVAVQDKMYVFGGRGDLNSPNHSDEEMYCSQLYYLDTIEHKWVAVDVVGSWPEGRRSHSAWLFGDYMYVFGGYNGNTKKHLNGLYRYSIKDNHWEYLHLAGPVPCKRRRQACVMYKDKAYLFGGTSPCLHRNVTPTINVAIPDENDDAERDNIDIDRQQDDADRFAEEPNRPLDEAEKLIDNNDLHVLDYAPTLKTLSILVVLEHNLDRSCLPWDVIFDIKAMTVHNCISRAISQSG